MQRRIPLLFFAILFFTSVQAQDSLFNFQSKALEKGKALLGGAFGFSTENRTDTKDLLGNDVNSRHDIEYDVFIYGGYFFKNNTAAGLKIGYNEMQQTLDLGSGTEQTINKSLERGYSVRPFLRNYVSLDRRGIFNLFNETSIAISSGQGVSQKDQAGELSREYSEYFSIGAGITPGLAVIMGDFVSVEASVDILGVKAEWREFKYDDNPEQGSTASFDGDFSLNLLSLNLGLVFYFN